MVLYFLLLNRPLLNMDLNQLSELGNRNETILELGLTQYHSEGSKCKFTPQNLETQLKNIWMKCENQTL